ncbi:MAG TPA: DNA-binding domain-containing protein [Rectinemataceae bacterium]|nr:DNA-binding domain-containing protein [Rectinemataceae bacterium]
MALRIRAIRNNLRSGPNPWYALASWSDTIESEAFIDRMAAGRTTLSKTDILAVCQLAREELTKMLAEGCYVKTPLGAALPVATGVLTSPDEPFRPKAPGSGHSLRFDFRIDPKIERDALRRIACVREGTVDRLSPTIMHVKALPDGATIREGGAIRISGSRLKFDASIETLGAFLIDSEAEETRISTYMEIRPSALIALLPPELEKGDYRLEVRTLSRGGDVLKSGASISLSIG